jgi:hypothetical protein
MKGFNLSTLTFASTFVIFYFAFQLSMSFDPNFGIENLYHLIFIIKNWPNDAHVGCDAPLKPKAMWCTPKLLYGLNFESKGWTMEG